MKIIKLIKKIVLFSIYNLIFIYSFASQYLFDSEKIINLYKIIYSPVVSEMIFEKKSNEKLLFSDQAFLNKLFLYENIDKIYENYFRKNISIGDNLKPTLKYMLEKTKVYMCNFSPLNSFEKRLLFESLFADESSLSQEEIKIIEIIKVTCGSLDNLSKEALLDKLIFFQSLLWHNLIKNLYLSNSQCSTADLLNRYLSELLFNHLILLLDKISSFDKEYDEFELNFEIETIKQEEDFLFRLYSHSSSSGENDFIYPLMAHLYSAFKGKEAAALYNKRGLFESLNNSCMKYIYTESGRRALKIHCMPLLNKENAMDVIQRRQLFIQLLASNPIEYENIKKLLSEISDIKKEKSKINIMKVETHLGKFIPTFPYNFNSSYTTYLISSAVEQWKSIGITYLMSFFQKKAAAESKEAGFFTSFFKTVTPFLFSYKDIRSDVESIVKSKAGYDSSKKMSFPLETFTTGVAATQFLGGAYFGTIALAQTGMALSDQWSSMRDIASYVSLCSKEIEKIKQLIEAVNDLYNKAGFFDMPYELLGGISIIKNKNTYSDILKLFSDWSANGLAGISNKIISLMIPGKLTYYYFKKLKNNTLISLLDSVVGEIDAAAAKVALLNNSNNYCIPDIQWNSSVPFIDIKAGWFAKLPNAVANDFKLGNDSPRNILLISPWGGGKTVILNTLILSFYWMNLGILPASSASMSYFDAIVDYVPHSDVHSSIGGGDSSHMADRRRMEDLKCFMESSNGFVFLCLDEIYRGSSQEDSVRSAEEDLKLLFSNENILNVVSTHYFPLVSLANHSNSADLYYLDIQEIKDGVFNPTYVLKKDAKNWWIDDAQKRYRYDQWHKSKMKRGRR